MNCAEVVIANSATKISGRSRFIFDPTLARSSRKLLVNAVLLLRTVHLDRDLVLRLIDFDVVSVRLQAWRDRLNSHFSVRHILQRRLSIRISLQLRAILGLLPVLAHRMKNYACIPDWLAVIATHD